MTRRTSMVASLLLVTLLAPQAQARGIVDDMVAVKSVTASSVLAGKNDRYAPLRAIDGTSDTAWCEGVADEGVGQSWTITFDTPTVVDEIELLPGMRKSDKLFQGNNLPVKLEVKVDGGKPVALSSTNWTRPKAKLPGTPTTTVTITFAEVQKRGANDTCLTEVHLSGRGRSLMLMTGIPRTAFSTLPPTVVALSAALKTCDAAVLSRLVRFPLRYVQGQEGPETPPLKYQFADVAALVKGCKKHQAPGGDHVDEKVQQSKDLEGLVGRRQHLDEVVIDPLMDYDIGQPWRFKWTQAAGWQLVEVDD